MGTRLEHVIARTVAEMRTDRGWTQAQLAFEMRARGFMWATNRVAQLETLRRPVSLLEVIALAMVFNVPVKRLLDGDDWIALPDGGQVSLFVLREALTGDVPPLTRSVMSDASARDQEDHLVDFEDLRKMAAKLGLDVPSDLEAFAYRIFGLGFQNERARRLGDVSGLSKRSAQTKRGHVSRALLAEIADYLGEGQQRLDRINALHTTTEATEGGKS